MQNFAPQVKVGQFLDRLLKMLNIELLLTTDILLSGLLSISSPLKIDVYAFTVGPLTRPISQCVFALRFEVSLNVPGRLKSHLI